MHSEQITAPDPKDRGMGRLVTAGLRIGLLALLLGSFIVQTIGAENGYPGVESKDPERFYHRLKSLRAKRPNDPENTYRIGNLYYSYKMEDEAIKEYRRCLKLDPNHLNAKWFLSHVLYSKGYYDEAFRLSREIIEKKPEDPEIFYWTGEVLMKLEQPTMAREYFIRCDELKLPPRKPVAIAD